MAINPDIRDQAYQFFVEEAPELLQEIEAGLLTLSQERSPAQVHVLMRSAHSIKGGAASVGLEAIASLSHRLENIFKALYSDTLEINTELEDQILRAYDCLRLPLMEQISAGGFDAERAIAAAEPVFSQIEAALGDAMSQTETYIPSSSELGVDMVASIFEVDVAQGIDRLAAVLADPQTHEVAGELRAQAEVFAGFAELLNLPEFGAIAATVQQAVALHPHRAIEIAQVALADFEASRQAVLTGGSLGPSAELAALATPAIAPDLSRAADAPVAAEGVAADLDMPLFDNLQDIFGSLAATDDWQTTANDADPTHLADWAAEAPLTEPLPLADALTEATQVEGLADALPALEAAPLEGEAIVPDWVVPAPAAVEMPTPVSSAPAPRSAGRRTTESGTNLTVRVDSARLEKINNLVGELAINRDALSLQNEQMQSVVRDLVTRFERFRGMVSQLREVSDQMLVAPERYSYGALSSSRASIADGAPAIVLNRPASSFAAEFDSLEMDRYGALHPQIQEMLESLMQLEETVEDVALFARQSNQMLDQQRNRLSQLQDEVIWARMLPLGEVLNRFPRLLRDLSNTYRKPVQLKLTGTGVLVEKAILEKLYDPLVHLLRNAFDHGIEAAELRRDRSKPEEGQIEIRAYHKGNQTIIEIRDDGQGLNLDRIRSRVLELNWLSPDQLAVLSDTHLYEFIFEPGFSTADRVSELSGRGVGLDVVRSQLRAIKGSVSVASTPGVGTVFTLYLPLTLTITKLIISLVGNTAIALPADCVEEILTPQPDQTQQSGNQRFLYWREQLIPAYRLGDLLHYTCPQPEAAPSKALITVPTPGDWALPMLILRQEQQIFAVEVDCLVTEQELVIKPFGAAIAPPPYTYGCTILADGSLVPVLDGAALLAFGLEQAAAAQAPASPPPTVLSTLQAPTILVVDDAVTLRRTLALSLERAGFRVLQARDGREAIAQLEKSPGVKLVVCDVEMPNMNGFEFLSHRRQDAHLSTIPIVMLTSRSNEKHRWLALQLGATAYFTKPYLEQEFLAAIDKILG